MISQNRISESVFFWKCKYSRLGTDFLNLKIRVLRPSLRSAISCVIIYFRFPIIATILAVVSGLMPGKSQMHLISSILSLVSLLSSAVYCGFAILTLVRNDIGLFWKVLFGSCVIFSGMISIFGQFSTACSIKNSKYRILTEKSGKLSEKLLFLLNSA